MNQYQDSPETQSPGQRSVVFAWLACIVTHFLCLWPQPYRLPYCDNWNRSTVEIVVPVIVAFIILYLGKLHQKWSKPARVFFLSMESVLVYLGMLAFLVAATIFSAVLLVFFEAGQMNRHHC
jgi:hypothetical protein